MAKVSVEPRTLPTRLFCLPKEVCITILPLKHVVYNYTGKTSTLPVNLFSMQHSE